MEKDEQQALPPLFRRHVRRPRLTRLLDETTARVIVLTAPAGYGKTTLAAEWLQGRDDVAWYRATPASRDVAAFVASFARSVRSRIPLAEVQRCVTIPDASPEAVKALAELIADDLNDAARAPIIAIDNYHLMDESEHIEGFLDSLLTLSAARLVVTTRRRPRWVTARRLLHGEVLQLGSEQLAMTQSEANDVLRGLSRAAVRTLLDSAAGWPALIGLGGLASQAALPRRVVAEALYSYLADEIFRQERPRVQDLMLRTSFLPSLEPRACEEILGISDVRELLDEVRANGLVHEYGGSGHFHPLLRDLLYRRLEEEQGEVLVELSHASVSWYCRRRSWDDAFDVAVRRGDHALAATIMYDAADDLLAAGRAQTLEHWIVACGPAAHTPPARLVQAQVLIRRGHCLEAEDVAREAIQLASSSVAYLSRAYWVMGQAAHLLSNYESAFEYHAKAHEHARSREDEARAAWGAFVAAAELDLDDLERFLDKVEETSASDLESRLRLAVGRLFASERRGSLAGVWTRARPLVQFASSCSDPMIRAGFMTSFGNACNIRGDFAFARKLATDAVSFARSASLDFAVGFGLLARGEAEVALRELASAHQTMDELARIAVHHQDPQFQVDLEILRWKISVTEKVGSFATSPIADAFADDPVPPTPYAEYLAIRALIRAANGDAAAAHAAIARARPLARAATASYLLAAASLVTDVVEGQVGPPEAADALSTLVKRAHAADALGTLVWAYRAYPPLLRLVDPATPTARALGPVIAEACDGPLAGREGVGWIAWPDGDYLRLLTPREREVYSLVVGGASNHDIAANLVISESTAKVHVAHILKKLGKASRVQLMLDARTFEVPAPTT